MHDVTPSDGVDTFDRSERVPDVALMESLWLVGKFCPDAIVVHQAGRVVYANDVALALVRARSFAELNGASIMDFVPPDGAAGLFDRLTGIGAQIGSSSKPTVTTIRDLTGGETPVRSATVRTEWNGGPAFQTMFRVQSLGLFADDPATTSPVALGSVDCAVVTLARDQTIETWNEAAEGLYGIPATAAVGAGWAEMTGAPEDLDVAAANTHVLHSLHRRVDGSPFAAHVSVTRSRHGYVVVCTELGVSLLAQLKSVLPSLQQAAVVVSADGIVELANPVAMALLSLSADLIPGTAAESLPLSFPDGGSPIFASLRDGTPVTDRIPLIAGPAGERKLLCSCRRLDSAPRSPLIVTLVDVTRHDDDTSLAVHRDSLTGLSNRAGIVDAIDTSLAAADRGVLLVYVVDLHKFATVNDVVGFDAGDKVIRTIGARIAAVAPGGAGVGRIGGDQFAIVTPIDGTRAAIGELIDRIHTVVTQPISYGLRSHRVTVGVGYTTAAADDERVAANLLRDAEIALHYAKRTPRLPFVEFQTAHRDKLHRKQYIEHDLRDTLLYHVDRLRIVYQPIVDLRTDRVVALEALLRWDHPILGVIWPNEFIPIAEESDLIDLIGAHVQQTAGREFTARAWTTEMVLTVNASRRELTDWNFPRRVRASIRDSGLPPWRLCIEATESMIVGGGDDVLPIISELRAAGILIALDDFGTGASSLSQLNDLPLDFLKTAKAFTDALDDRDGAQAVLAAITAIGDANGMRVIVEGVETSAQAAAVERAGASLAQGYRFARPKSLDELEELIDIESAADPRAPLGGRALRAQPSAS